jgi:phosphoribosylamine--glycine ligase
VESEGNKVKLSIQESGFDLTGAGLVEKVLNFDAAVDWADVVVYDVHRGKLPEEADKIRMRKPTVGSSELGGRLEHDRKFGMEFAKAGGIAVADFQEFSGPMAFRKASEFLFSKPSDVAWVFKIEGKAPENVGTYVAKEGRNEMLRMLMYFQDQYVREKVQPKFILTKKIDGVEVSTEAWFNGMDFFLPNHTIERTKLFPGDLGEKTGCEGNVVWSAPESPLYHRLLAPLRAALDGKFVGPLDVNVIIDNENEPTFLEFSPRFGYDAIFSFMELFDTDFGEFLYQIAVGQRWVGKVREEFAGDVRVHIPPFPSKGRSDSDSQAEGVPIFGYDARKFNRHVHPAEVMLDKDNKTVTSGPHGFVLSATGLGDSPGDAERAAYSQVDKIHIPNMRYRNDLTDVIQGIYDDLQATGWLNTGKKVEPISLGWPRRNYGKLLYVR